MGRVGRRRCLSCSRQIDALVTPESQTHSRHTQHPPFEAGKASFQALPEVPGSGGMMALVVESAQAHFVAGHYAVADAFLKLIQQDDAPPGSIWEQLGQLHFRLAEYESAGRAYGYAAAYDPQNATLQTRLAQICLCLDDIPSFEGYLRRALRLDSACAPALQLLADLNRDHGHYADAITFYGRLVEKQPDDYGSLLSLAFCNFHLGELGAAQGCLQRACQVARGERSHSATSPE